MKQSHSPSSPASFYPGHMRHEMALYSCPQTSPQDAQTHSWRASAKILLLLACGGEPASYSCSGFRSHPRQHRPRPQLPKTHSFRSMCTSSGNPTGLSNNGILCWRTWPFPSHSARSEHTGMFRFPSVATSPGLNPLNPKIIRTIPPRKAASNPRSAFLSSLQAFSPVSASSGRFFPFSAPAVSEYSGRRPPV